MTLVHTKTFKTLKKAEDYRNEIIIKFPNKDITIINSNANEINLNNKYQVRVHN